MGGLFLKRQCQIRMPSDQPVGINALIKVDSADRARLGKEMRTNKIEDAGRRSQLCDMRDTQQSPSSSSRNRTQSINQPVLFRSPENIWNDLKPMFFHCHA